MSHHTRMCRECLLRPLARSTGQKCTECLQRNEARAQSSRHAASVRTLVARQVWQEAGGRCEYCGRAVRRKRDKYDAGCDIGEIDHVIPAALGGTGERENLKLSCKQCNRRREAESRPAVRRYIEEEKRRTA